MSLEVTVEVVTAPSPIAESATKKQEEAPVAGEQWRCHLWVEDPV